MPPSRACSGTWDFRAAAHPQACPSAGASTTMAEPFQQGHCWDGGAGVERRGRSQPLLLAPPCPSRELWPSESWGLILAFEML